jgi:hypothetical protein
MQCYFYDGADLHLLHWPVGVANETLPGIATLSTARLHLLSHIYELDLCHPPRKKRKADRHQSSYGKVHWPANLLEISVELLGSTASCLRWRRVMPQLCLA